MRPTPTSWPPCGPWPRSAPGRPSSNPGSGTTSTPAGPRVPPPRHGRHPAPATRRPPGVREEAEGPAPITLATIHTTKGLEWDHVIVHDVRGDLHPHRLAIDTEEERRIFHVAITRGRHSVLVNAVGPGVPHPRSPFLEELTEPRPADLPWPAEPEPTQATLVTSAGEGAGTKKRERAEPGSKEESARREALTSWRLQRCKDDGVPAYVVLDNATLDAIAAAMPTSLADLGRIKGIGPAKLDRYGADILGIIENAD